MSRIKSVVTSSYDNPSPTPSSFLQEFETPGYTNMMMKGASMITNIFQNLFPMQMNGISREFQVCLMSRRP